MLMQPKTILVRAPNWIGDQILAYPFFYYLRKTYPQAHITSVCVPWVKDLQFADLINDVVVLPSARNRGILEKIRALNEGARKLRHFTNWDLAISLPNSLSAGWLLYRSGAKIRRGYKVDGRGIFLNDGIDWDSSSSRHRAQAYLDLLPMKAKPSRPATQFWGWKPSEDEEQAGVAQRIPPEVSEFRPEVSWPGREQVHVPDEPYWVMAPGATAESRRWPIEYFLRVAEKVIKETGWRGVVVGGPGEASLAAYLCKDTRLRLLDRTALGPVSGLAQIFKHSRFTLTNESGLAHVAALCGASVQVVCGAADPQRTQPLGPGAVQVSINAVDCWPCEKNVCFQPPDQKVKCLRGIEPDMVWEEIHRGFLEKAKKTVT
jgi:heptosyltransferase-2